MGVRGAIVKENKGERCCYCQRVTLPSSYAEDPDVSKRLLVGTVEHKIPRSKGGSNERENLLHCCARCNSMRGSLDYGIFVLFSQVILRKHANESNTLLRACLQQFVTSLAEIAIRNKRESRRAISLALLSLGEALKNRR